MISHDAFWPDEDLVDHRVTMVTVHFMDAMLVKLGQRQQHPQGQSLGLLTVAQLHRLDTTAEPEVAHRKERWRAKKKCMNVNNAGQRMQLRVASNLKTLFHTATVIVFSQKQTCGKYSTLSLKGTLNHQLYWQVFYAATQIWTSSAYTGGWLVEL